MHFKKTKLRNANIATLKKQVIIFLVVLNSMTDIR